MKKRSSAIVSTTAQSSVCTSRAVTDELLQCEKKMQACRAKAEKRRAAEAQRLEQVLAKRKELEEAHRRRLAAAREEIDRGAQGILSKAEEDIKEALRLEDEAEAQIRDTDAKTAALEREAGALERRLFDANSELDVQEAGALQSYEETRSGADSAVVAKLEECREVVRDCALYSAEVQDTTFQSIAEMQDALRSQISQADERSRQRSRMKDLCETLAMMKGSSARDLSQHEFLQAKAVILQSWLGDWVTETHVRTPSTTLPSPSPGLLKPQSPWGPRSVDRARRRADDELRLRTIGNVDSWGSSLPQFSFGGGSCRPQTAP